MIHFILALTIISIAMPFYVYIGYPLILYILNKLLPKKTIDIANVTPSVAVFVSCYNEDDVIERKIQNCLTLDYPKELIEFIFISDGSDDNTDDIIKQYEDKGIRLIRQKGRLGKTSGLNLAMPETQADIIIFSDANAIYDSQAIKMLVRNFHDTKVGYAVGAALYTDGGKSAAANSENTYWQYELAIKKMETNLHSVVGGDGAIYAIRRELYEPLDREDINDFVNPLQIIAKGYRGVFEPEAKCFEETAGDFDKEGKRKERIVNRSFRGLMKVKSVMNPLKTGIFSFEVVSHKLLRWLVPVFLLIAATGSILLSLLGLQVFHYATVSGILFLWLALIGYFQSSSSALFYYPYYFILVNMRALLGIISALQGNIQVTWSSPRAKQGTNKQSDRAIVYSVVFFLSSGWIMATAINKILI